MTIYSITCRHRTTYYSQEESVDSAIKQIQHGNEFEVHHGVAVFNTDTHEFWVPDDVNDELGEDNWMVNAARSAILERFPVQPRQLKLSGFFDGFFDD